MFGGTRTIGMLEEVLSALIFIIVCCLLVIHYVRLRSLPPGPLAWPLIGNIRMFQKDAEGYKKFTALAEKYGNVYRYAYARLFLALLLSVLCSRHKSTGAL